MPPYALWSLVVGLVLLSLGLSFKFAQTRFSFELANKEINRLVEQIALIKKHQEESVSSLAKLNQAEINKIFEEHRNQIDLLNKIILDMKTPTNYIAYLKKGTKPKMTIGLAKAILDGDVVITKET